MANSSELQQQKRRKNEVCTIWTQAEACHQELLALWTADSLGAKSQWNLPKLSHHFLPPQEPLATLPCQSCSPFLPGYQKNPNAAEIVTCVHCHGRGLRSSFRRGKHQDYIVEKLEAEAPMDVEELQKSLGSLKLERRSSTPTTSFLMEESELDPNLAESVADEIYALRRRHMDAEKRRPNAAAVAQGMSNETRHVVLPWMYQVAQSFRIPDVVVFTAIETLDRYCARRRMERERLQLLAVAAIGIAWKIEGPYDSVHQFYTYIQSSLRGHGNQNSRIVAEVETSLLMTLSFDIRNSSPAEFLSCQVVQELHSLHPDLSQASWKVCRNLLFLSISHPQFYYNYPSSVLAAVALNLAVRQCCAGAELAGYKIDEKQLLVGTASRFLCLLDAQEQTAAECHEEDQWGGTHHKSRRVAGVEMYEATPDLNFCHCAFCELEWPVPGPRDGCCTHRHCKLALEDGRLPIKVLKAAAENKTRPSRQEETPAQIPPEEAALSSGDEEGWVKLHRSDPETSDEESIAAASSYTFAANWKERMPSDDSDWNLIGSITTTEL